MLGEQAKAVAEHQRRRFNELVDVFDRPQPLAGVYCEGRNKTLLNPFKYFYLSQFHIAVALPFCITLY